MGNGKGELLEMLLAGGSFLAPEARGAEHLSTTRPRLQLPPLRPRPPLPLHPGPSPEGSGSPTPATPAQPGASS